MAIMTPVTGEPTVSDEPPEQPPEQAPAGEPRKRGPVRRVLGWGLTALAAVFVLFALNVPNQQEMVSLGALLRIPAEGLVGAALLLVLPRTPRRIGAVVLGVILGLLTLIKLADIGFYSVFEQPFDIVLDWSFFGNGMDFLTTTYGRGVAIGAALGAIVLVVAVLVLMALAVLRLSRQLVEHRREATGVTAGLTVAWFVLVAFGVAAGPAVPASALAYDHARQVSAGLTDKEKFDREAGSDPFGRTPASDLLTALRGKKVILAFFESYGRSAVEDPELAPQVGAALADGTQKLKASGFDARTGWLQSPTAGGGSWLAESTLLSGLWINNQQRFNNLIKSDRLSLTRAFKKAGWATVGVEPGNSGAWPEGAYYGLDTTFDSQGLGYQGPKFGWSNMPDQYTLQAFERAKAKLPTDKPIMMETALTSSHIPWAPLPKMVDWNDLGDGSIYGPIAKAADQQSEVWKDASKVQAAYGQSVIYVWNTLVSYMQKYADNDTVLVVLGDHQPARIVTGLGKTGDVPISIIAHDPDVMTRINSWNWATGLKPLPDTPVWKMSEFRDKFLTAYGPPK
jgi:hypothetical protein